MNESTHYICFNCASIFPIVEDKELSCHDCGYAVKAETYNKIMNYAFDAAYFGHLYRKAYEKQLAEKKEIKRRYFLGEPSTILCFVAVAALSGVIGNLTTELVKKIYRAIASKAKKCNEDIGQKEDAFLNNFDIDVYIEEVKIFHNDFQGIDPAVRSSIKEEMIVHEMGNSLLPMINKGEDISQEMIAEAVKKAFEKIESRKKLSKQDIDNFWKAIDTGS